MKALLIFYFAFIYCLCLALGAPIANAENAPGVQFLKYKDDKELEEIQRQIIAQYEQLGGSSQVHQVQTAQVVDLHNLKINGF